MKKLLLIALILISVAFQYGCAASMAANQPDAKDLSLFTPGTARAMVLAEYGKPISSENINGKKTEIYKFTDGYSTGAKVVRIMFHVAGDVFTLFLWEFIGMPIEAGFDGEDMAYEVTFDDNNRVATANILKGEAPEKAETAAGDCDPNLDTCS